MGGRALAVHADVVELADCVDRFCGDFLRVDVCMGVDDGHFSVPRIRSCRHLRCST